jgi:hypothetical protein
MLGVFARGGAELFEDLHSTMPAFRGPRRAAYWAVPRVLTCEDIIAAS